MKKRTIKKMKGAVTIFLVIVLFTTTLLGGVFIDATRILLAKRTLRNSINSAARSALSYYDEDISSVYGLFGVTEDEATEAFEKYLNANLRLSKNDGFNIMEITPIDDGIHITLTGALSENDIMQSGMNEYAKYRAAVDTVLGIVEKLKDAFGNNSAMSKVKNSTQKGKSAMEALKSEAKEFSNNARKLISDGLQTQVDKCKDYVDTLTKDPNAPLDDDSLGFTEMDKQFDEAYAESSNIDDSIKKYDDDTAKAAKDLSGTKPGTVSYYDEDSGSWITDGGSKVEDDEGLKDSAEKQADSLRKSAKDEKTAVEKKIDATEENYQNIKQQIKQKMRESQALTVEINRLKLVEADAKIVVDDAKESLSEAKKDKRENRFAFIFGDNPDQTLVSMKASLDLANSQLKLLKAQDADEDAIKKQEQEIKRLEKQIDDYVEGMENPPKNAYDDRIKDAESAKKSAEGALDAVKSSIKDCEKKQKKLNEEIKELYQKIPAGKSSAGDVSMSENLDATAKKEADVTLGTFINNVQDFFDELSKTANDNPNSPGSGSFTINSGTDRGIWKIVDDLITTMDGICHLFSGNLGDAYLATDYAFSKFSFLTSQTSWSKHYFQWGEIEYILEGLPSQVGSIGATLGKIFLLRLAINFVNYMVTSSVPGIIARIVYCVARAAIQSAVDMGEMIFITDADSEKSATCQLCPSAKKVRLKYSDHLKLRFLLDYLSDRGRSGIMTRMREMIDISSEKQGWEKTSELYTRIQGTAEVKVNLIMLTLPMFESVLPKDNKIIQDGHFILRETVELGY